MRRLKFEVEPPAHEILKRSRLFNLQGECHLELEDCFPRIVEELLGPGTIAADKTLALAGAHLSFDAKPLL